MTDENTDEFGRFTVEPRSHYDARQGMNWSRLRHILASQRAYATQAQRVDSQTPAMRLGTVIHAAVLEHRYPVVFDGPRSGRRWEEFQADHSGQEIVNVRENGIINSIVQAIQDHSAAYALLGKCQLREVTVTRRIDGLLCKGRLDACDSPCSLLADLKSTASIPTPHAWERHAAAMGYHSQMAWYRWLIGRDVPVFQVVAQVSWPYEVAVFRYSEDALASGLEDAQRAARELRLLNLQSDPPRFALPNVVELGLPRWMTADEGDALEGIDTTGVL